MVYLYYGLLDAAIRGGSALPAKPSMLGVGRLRENAYAWSIFCEQNPMLCKHVCCMYVGKGSGKIGLKFNSGFPGEWDCVRMSGHGEECSFLLYYSSTFTFFFLNFSQ